MKNPKKYFAIVSLIISGCVNNKQTQITDPKKFATAFCNCMEKNGSPKEYLYALSVCDGELIQKCRFYRLHRINIRYNTSDTVDYQTRTEVAVFMNTVDSLTHINCCDVALKCPPDNSKQ